MFFINICYNSWDYVTETRVRYVRPHIDQLIEDLRIFTGKAGAEKRFKEVMLIFQCNSYLWVRTNDLLHHKPAPIGSLELLNYMSATVCNRGKTSTFPVEQGYRGPGTALPAGLI